MSQVAQRMHMINRVGLGESTFAWHVAELAKALGQDFSEGLRDREVNEAFGDGYGRGRLASREAQVDALLARLRARLLPR